VPLSAPQRASCLASDRGLPCANRGESAPQMGMGLGLALAAVYALAAPYIPLLFSSDAEVDDAVLELLPLATALMPMSSLVFVLDGILLGASDFRFLAGEGVSQAGRQAGRQTRQFLGRCACVLVCARALVRVCTRGERGRVRVERQRLHWGGRGAGTSGVMPPDWARAA
jgi:hypothetical protein